jgi:transposase
MHLTDFARQLPQEVWELFEPLLPPVVWWGNGRPPARNSDCLPALFYVLVSGIAWRMLPKGFPSSKTVQRRLPGWLQRDTFRAAWQHLAQRYAVFQGINWDQSLLDGSKKPSKKGANRRGRVPWIVGNVVRPSPSPAMPVPCPWARSSRGPMPMMVVKRRTSYKVWWCVLQTLRAAETLGIVETCRVHKRMVPMATSRRTTEPSGPASACKPPSVGKPAPGEARFATLSSAARTFSLNSAECSGASTVRLAPTWRGLKWLPVSSCYARVLSHSPRFWCKTLAPPCALMPRGMTDRKEGNPCCGNAMRR